MSDDEATQGDGREPGLPPEGEPQSEPAAGASSRPRRGDKSPRKRAKRKRASSTASSAPEPGAAPARGAVRKQQDARLESALAEVLVFPAMPAMMLAPDPLTRAYLPEHFIRTGPKTAKELVAASEASPELRAVLERVAFGSSMLGLVMAVVGYAAPPVMWMIGMRSQAAALTQAASMDEAAMQSMIAKAQADAAAQAQAAQQPANGAQGAEHGGPAGAQTPQARTDPQ